MTLLNKKGVSVINRHTNNINETEEFVFTRSFIADEEDVLNNPHWRNTKMCNFLDRAYERLLELKGEEYADYALPIDEPIIKPYDSNDSLCPQVVVTFTTSLPGRKVLH